MRGVKKIELLSDKGIMRQGLKCMWFKNLGLISMITIATPKSFAGVHHNAEVYPKIYLGFFV